MASLACCLSGVCCTKATPCESSARGRARGDYQHGCNQVSAEMSDAFPNARITLNVPVRVLVPLLATSPLLSGRSQGARREQCLSFCEMVEVKYIALFFFIDFCVYVCVGFESKIFS